MWRVRLRQRPLDHRIKKLGAGSINRCVMNRGGGGKSSGDKPGAFKTFFDHVKQGIEKNQEMQQSLKNLQQEAAKLGQSRMLLTIRTRVLGLRLVAGRVLISAFNFTRHYWDLASNFSLKAYREAAKSKQVEQAVHSAKETVKKVSQQGEELSQTEAFKTVSKGFQTVKTELLEDIAAESQPYQSPEVLLKRSDPARGGQDVAQAIKPNEDARGVTLHKYSQWLSYWKRIKESNPLSNALYSAKMRYDESDSILVRTSRVVTDKVEDAVTGMVTQTDMASTLAEIAKVDPHFTKEAFLSDLQFDIIPNILEAFLKGKIDILHDWCHEAAYNVLKAHIDLESLKGARVLDSRVLDVRHVDILVAKLMEQGPIFVITFVAQEIGIVRDHEGSIVKGNENNINNVQYVWAVCRDQTIHNPKTAWRLSEFAIHSENQLLI